MSGSSRTKLLTSSYTGSVQNLNATIQQDINIGDTSDNQVLGNKIRVDFFIGKREHLNTFLI
jgi:hypothetical protein